MTVLNRNPSNPNMLQPNKFTLNLSRAPNLQYFCQTVTLPGISTSEIPVQNPFVELYAPGEKAIYDTLNITFLVDAEMTAWLEIHDWLRAMTFPTTFEEYKGLNQLSPYADKEFPQFSDAHLTILTSANNPNYRVKFIDCFPISLSSVMFSAMDGPDNIITADASFRFSYFNIDRM